MGRSFWKTTLLWSGSRTPWMPQKIRVRVAQPRHPPVLEVGKVFLIHRWHIGCHRFSTVTITPCFPEALALQGRSEGCLDRKTSPFSCWVVLRCGSSRVAGKVVGGLRAKGNEGIIESAFCMSIYPGSSCNTQPPDPTGPQARRAGL